MKYLLLWKPGTNHLSHFLHVQVMWLSVSVGHVGGFNTSACLNHDRNYEGGVVMLQYIISVVFLYLKYICYIFMIFFFLFLHEPTERQLMLKLPTMLIYWLWFSEGKPVLDTLAQSDVLKVNPWAVFIYIYVSLYVDFIYHLRVQKFCYHLKLILIVLQYNLCVFVYSVSWTFATK